jgi:hypothetical protein
MNEYYVSRDGDQFGPYDEAQTRAFFSDGSLAATDLLWCDGMLAWQSATEVFGAKSTVHGPVVPLMPPSAEQSNEPTASRPRTDSAQGSMKGTILDFNIRTGQGIVSGDDNNRYRFTGSDWQASDSPAPGQRVDFEVNEGQATFVYRELSKPIAGSTTTSLEMDWSGLSPYYQAEFKKIFESGETYKGKLNWAAFLFGGFWAMTKQLWLSLAICVVGSLMTGGLVGFVYWFVYAFRGNYIYYTLYVKKKQLWI